MPEGVQNIFSQYLGNIFVASYEIEMGEPE